MITTSTYEQIFEGRKLSNEMFSQSHSSTEHLKDPVCVYVCVSIPMSVGV